MPRVSKEFKEAIASLPEEELQKLVIKAASKSQEIFDWITFNYLNGDEAAEELLEDTKEMAVYEIHSYSTRGIFQKQMAKSIGEAVKHVNSYAKTTKNKKGEADLLLAVLEAVFENFADELGTCWTVFDSKLAVTTNRLYNLVTKNLHEDYLIEYQEPLNRFLDVLHAKSGFLGYVYKMPKSV